MAAIHTEASAIFGGLLHNEAKEKINFVKFRPTLLYNSKTPVNRTIPGNSSQYVSLCDSYLFIQCHVEETDQYGNANKMTSEHPKRSVEEEEQDADESTGPQPNGSRVRRLPIMRGSKKKEEAPTLKEVEDYLEDAEKKVDVSKKSLGLNMRQKGIKRGKKEKRRSHYLGLHG